MSSKSVLQVTGKDGEALCKDPKVKRSNLFCCMCFFQIKRKLPRKHRSKDPKNAWIQWPMVLVFSQCPVSSQSQLRGDMILRGLHLHKRLAAFYEFYVLESLFQWTHSLENRQR